MAWSAPMTAVAGSIFTAAQFNTFVRDNLNATAPALATTIGSIFVTTGTNAIAERVPSATFDTTSDTLTGTAYGDPSASVGPAITVTTGTKAIVFVAARLANNTTGSNTYASYAVTGATSDAAVDERAFFFTINTANESVQACNINFHTGLTAGSNTFTMKYRVTAGTGTVDNRRIVVIPL